MWQELRPGDRDRSERRRLARPLTVALLAAFGLAVTACTPQTSGPVTPPATLAPTTSAPSMSPTPTPTATVTATPTPIMTVTAIPTVTATPTTTVTAIPAP